MENLIKPSQYAKQYGISRQAVYAKIKKGTVSSKEINGQIYIDLNSDIELPKVEIEKKQENIHQKEHIASTTINTEYQTILSSKNETIEILKSRINDLKESNEQMTSVLRGEIDLLKQAFNEMKSIYAHKLLSAQNLPKISSENKSTIDMKTEQYDYKQWITVVRYLYKYSINPKYYANIMDYVDKIYENGDSRTKLINHEIRLDSQMVDLEFAREALS